MRVLVDTSYADRGPSGTAVYLDRFMDALRKRGNVELVEASQPRRLRSGRSGRVRNPLRSAANAALDFDWLHRGLPRAARQSGAEVVHHPLPVYSPRIQAAQVATIHDVAFERIPDAYGSLWRRVAGRQYRAAARGCRALVCVSETTARDAAELLGADRERVVVAPHGPGQRLPEIERLPEPRHFLYVGDAEDRKQVVPLIAMYREYAARSERPLPLVLAGGAAEYAQDDVLGEPRVSSARLAELLAGAAALVHAALYEGFGLTPLEAMALGTPVLVRPNPAVEEVCGDAAYHLDVESLERVASDPEFRERLSRAGLERVSRFSWDESALRHERAYTLALDAPRTEASDSDQ